jgi:o-succinylbenzoate synthase
MVKHLYEYKKSLILQIDDGWGEISPLPGFSKETFLDAKNEVLGLLFENKKPTLPSVIFGLSSASKPFSLSPLRVPLCALNSPKQGCKTLKLKLGHLNLLEALSLVSKYIGKYTLRLDFNQKWTLSNALAFTSHFSPSDFEYLEEPVNSYEDLIEFSHITQFPIALDETLLEKTGLEIPSFKYAVIKPTLWGTIPSLSRPIVLSSSYESSLGILQIGRLTSSHIALGLDTFSSDFIDPPLQCDNGYLTWKGSKNPINIEKLCLIASAP